MLSRKTLRQGFSLIELSVVILVISVLIAGTIQGYNFVNKSQLLTARQLTNSSPVSGVKDLLVWYETTLETSFQASQAIDEAKVSTWYDNNPQTLQKRTATNSLAASHPTFDDNGFSNAVPSLQFDGEDDF